jgi:hypothetical protein
MTKFMDKLQLTGQNLGRVFNIRSGHFACSAILVLSVKLPNLKLKTRSKQLLGSLPLVIVRHAKLARFCSMTRFQIQILAFNN